MTFILSLAVFLLVLGFLVFIHELGHFAVAKWVGMRVDEFAIGFPPRVVAKQKGETLYALNAIPFGGYVKIHGEGHEEDAAEDARSFDRKPIWARLAVMLAGVTMNVLFAFIALVVAFSVGFTSIGQDLTQIPGAQITQREVLVSGLIADGPAAQAGLKVGDIVREFVSPDGSPRSVRTINELIDYSKSLQAQGVETVVVRYTREGTNAELTTTLNKEGPALGIGIQSLDTVRVPVAQAFKVAYNESKIIVELTWDALKKFGSRLFTRAQLDEDVSGPLGIYQATATATKIGFAQIIFITIVLSLNLALLNLLPIPALDGGKVVLIAVETLFKNKVAYRRVEMILTTLSFFFLIGLMLILTVRDVGRLF